MTDPKRPPEEPGRAGKQAAEQLPPLKATTARMNEDVPEWSDPVCSCEAEPYWLEVSDEIEDKQQAGEENRTP